VPAASRLPQLSLETPYDAGNFLARQARGEVPTAKIWEDRYVVAILVDTVGHFVVVSKTSRARNLIEADPATLARMNALVQRVARAEIAALGADGFLFRSTAGTQSGIGQFHIHGFPTFSGAPPATAIPKVDATQLAPVAARIAAALR
jgi:histidine triad (HIT) family protein